MSMLGNRVAWLPILWLLAGIGLPEPTTRDRIAARPAVARPQPQAVRPLALVAADFDEDGTPDLVIGYADADAGLLRRLRGNPDAIYPNAPEAQRRRAEGRFTEAPFLSLAARVAVPQAPDFLGAGDFDGDGHPDLAVAARGGRALWLLAGDGHGGFAAPKEIALPGAATAFAVGEINRRDGLEDIAVAIDGSDGPRVLVFEGATGALRERPESFPMPAPATALAFGHLDEDSDRDLAVAAGRELVLIHGRDRKLSLGERDRAAVASARITGRTLPFAVRAMTNGTEPASLVLLSEDGAIHRLASFDQEPVVDAPAVSATALFPAAGGIIAIDDARPQVRVLAGREIASFDTDAPPTAALGLRLNAHARDSLVLLQAGRLDPTILSARAAATYVVNSADDHDDGKCDDKDCTLREAINAANANANADLISFNIPAKRALAPLRRPFALLPELLAPTRLAAAVTIQLRSPLPDITDSVTIDGTTQPGFAGTPLVQLTDYELRIAEGGTTIRGLALPGIFIFFGVSTRNRGNYRIEGNVIGLNALATGASVSLFGVAGIVIGGSSASARNVLSGIAVPTFATGSDLLIEGNYIGTDASGSRALGNGTGIANSGGPDNGIRGLTIHNNLISGNDIGIIIGYGKDVLITGNLIGTDAAGAKAIPNGAGMRFVGTEATIGGTAPSSRNVISGNQQWGIRADRGSTLQIQGNYVGLSASGTDAIPNRTGIEVYYSATIGGSIPEARNVISGNTSDGILVVGGITNIRGNYIGTDASGTGPVPNLGNGVILSAATGMIGGPGEKDGNLISANGENGVAIGPERSFPNESGGFVIKFGGSFVTLQGNFIGTDRTGEEALGNQKNGIFWDNSTSLSLVIRNRIAFNKGSGVSIPKQGSDPQRPPGAQITMSENSIFSNGVIGIDLGAPGPTENEFPPPPNTEANDGQNFPDLENVRSDAAKTLIKGSLFSRPSTTYTLEFFYNPGENTPGVAPPPGAACKPEGKTFLFSTQVVTREDGYALFEVTYPKSIPRGFVNATATSASGGRPGNTSEYSTCLQAELPAPPPPPGPLLQEITVLSDSITAIGFGFVAPVQVLVDGVGFEAPAIVEAGRKVIQRGKLSNGKTIAETIPPGKTVTLTFRNPNGGQVVASFRN